MPVYPCVKCNAPVDPVSDKACKNCREAKPLECSRCNKRITTEEVFEREKLKTKKPIFCLECGEREEVVKCAICNLSLQRHTGSQISQAPGARVYHPRCLTERQGQLDKLLKAAPAMAVVGAIVGGLMGGSYLRGIGHAGGAIAFGAIFFLLTTLLRTRMTPR
jgi:hypothetical protein